MERHRRDFLKILGGALAIPFLDASKTNAHPPEYELSELTPEKIADAKRLSANQLLDGFWNIERLRARITSTIFRRQRNRPEMEQNLIQRSKMEIPTEKDIQDLFTDYSHPEQLPKLIANIEPNSCGIFEAGDSQCLYVLKKSSDGKIRFEKKYTMSTSEDDWSNEIGSGGTSLGLMWVDNIREGVLGEVVSEHDKRERRAHFLPPGERDLTQTLIVNSLDRSNQLATMTTLAFALWDEINGTMRGEFIHGTNRENILGQRASGGCTRMANIDVQDLRQYVKTRVDARGNVIGKGTPVMIAAKGRLPMIQRRPAPRPKAPPPPAKKDRPWDWRY